MKYLLDTNILSELKKPKPNQKVVNFIESLEDEMLYISCISIGEIKHGIELCRDKKKSKELNLWFRKYLLSQLGQRIIEIDSEIMQQWGELMAKTKNLPIIDSLIAATCIQYKLCLVTRNVKDFNKINGLKLLDPFE